MDWKNVRINLETEPVMHTERFEDDEHIRILDDESFEEAKSQYKFIVINALYETCAYCGYDGSSAVSRTANSLQIGTHTLTPFLRSESS